MENKDKQAYSHVISREVAAELLQSGQLEVVFLLPALFGGTDDPRNVSFVAPGTADAKRIVDDTVAGMVEEGLVTNYRAAPEYRPGSIVPCRIRISAWSESRAGRFEAVVEVW